MYDTAVLRSVISMSVSFLTGFMVYLYIYMLQSHQGHQVTDSFTSGLVSDQTVTVGYI